MEDTLQEPEQISWPLQKQGPHHVRTEKKKKRTVKIREVAEQAQGAE